MDTKDAIKFSIGSDKDPLDPDQVGSLLIDHFDGLHSFDDLPRDGKTVRDMWF